MQFVDWRGGIAEDIDGDSNSAAAQTAALSPSAGDVTLTADNL
jgi:hypothetical protein